MPLRVLSIGRHSLCRCGLSEDCSACLGSTIVSRRLIFNCAGVDGSGALSPDNLFDLLGCCVVLAFEMSGDKKVFRLRLSWAGFDDFAGSGEGSDSIAFVVCSCFERVRLKRKPLSSSSYAITSQKGSSTNVPIENVKRATPLTWLLLSTIRAAYMTVHLALSLSCRRHSVYLRTL